MNLRFNPAILLAASLATISAQTPTAAVPDLLPPPQDQGLPNTRSAYAAALAKIKDGVAIGVGSRYAFIKGHRVRLDENDLLHAEAFEKGGKLYLPWAFALLLNHLNELTFPPVPSDLASISDRWVYAPSDLWPGLKAALLVPPPQSDAIQVGDDIYVPLSEGNMTGGHFTSLGEGIYYFGEKPLKQFSQDDSKLKDSLVALFDTPEKYANPEIATRSVPALARRICFVRAAAAARMTTGAESRNSCRWCRRYQRHPGPPDRQVRLPRAGSPNV
jgi:hypothetical protein